MRPAARTTLLTMLAFAAAAACLMAIVGGVDALGLRTGGPVARTAASAGPRCVPSTLNRSALLGRTHVAASPLPGSYVASPRTAISLLGAPAASLGAIRVTGSRSGSHGGRVVAFSQGDGAAFVPTAPFQAGESVTVTGRARSLPFSYRFTVARQDYSLSTYAVALAPKPTEQQHFLSRPDITPPLLQVNTRSSLTAPGLIFAAPYSGHGPAGPMIFDEAGNVVWFHPLPKGTEAANLQVQQYAGAPTLTWWQGRITPQGFGEGEEILANSSYQQIGHVRAGNGYAADLHEFQISPRGTALLTVLHPVECDLAPYGGPAFGAATDSIFQEVDLATGLVRREWHSLDHVSPADSFSAAAGTSLAWPVDYFHLNSVQQLASGHTLLSARNTWALYETGTVSGQILSRIGGRHSTVRLGPGTATAFQHDATALPNGTISIFDNGAVPAVHPQSRAMIVLLNAGARTDSLVAQYEHPGGRGLSSGSQGNVQLLENGDLFVGWGSQPYFSEFSPSGALLFDAHMHGSYQSYRAYRFQWTGVPAEAPAIAVSAPAAGGSFSAYASWNGDTRTAQWRLLGGPSQESMSPLELVPRTGFESTLSSPAPEAFVAVQALDAAGNVLGVSPTIPG